MKLPVAFAALRNPDYRMLWLGAIGAFAGTQMFFLARGYLAYELTGSAAILGVVTLAQGAPMLILSLFGGVIADRVQKRRLLFMTHISLSIIALIAAILTQTGAIQIWHLVVLGLLQGAVFSFNGPARQAYMIELVTPEELPRAIALFNSTPMSVRIIAPSLAGALIALPFIGTKYIFYFVLACYLLPQLLLYLIKTPPRAITRARTAIMTDFGEGLRYVRSNDVLRLLVLAAVLPTLFGNAYNNLLPVFASKDVLDVGASGLGLLSTAAGVGSVFGALAIASASRVPRRGLVQLSCGLGLGTGLILFGLSPSLPLALASLTLVGLAGSAFATLNSTMIISVSDPAFYGRVSSIQQVNFSLVNMAVLPIGFVVDQIGAPAMIIVCGAFVIAFWLFIAGFVRGYREIESVTAKKEEEVMESLTGLSMASPVR